MFGRIFKTREEYRSSWDFSFKQVPAIPLNLDIELSATCNLRCSFCFLSNKNYKIPDVKFMSRKMAFRLIDMAAEIGIPALKFNWRGEPTLHRNFKEIVSYALDKGCFFDLLVNTNGAGPRKALCGLANCTKIMVSLDSADVECNSKMRKPGNLRLATETVMGLVHMGHRDIWVRRVITDQNKDEDFKNNVKKIFGDSIKISEHHCFERGGKEQQRPAKRKFCGYPNQRLIVAVDGSVHPCCIDYNGKLAIGNINNDSLLDLWNCEKLNDLRKNLMENNLTKIPESCRNCTSWMAYDCQQREKVQDKNL